MRPLNRNTLYNIAAGSNKTMRLAEYEEQLDFWSDVLRDEVLPSGLRGQFPDYSSEFVTAQVNASNIRSQFEKRLVVVPPPEPEVVEVTVSEPEDIKKGFGEKLTAAVNIKKNSSPQNPEDDKPKRSTTKMEQMGFAW